MILMLVFVCNETLAKEKIRIIETSYGKLIEKHFTNDDSKEGYYVYQVESICDKITSTKQHKGELIAKGRVHPLFYDVSLYKKETVAFTKTITNDFLKSGGSNLFKGRKVFSHMTYLLNGDGSVLCYSIVTKVSVLDFCSAEDIAKTFIHANTYKFSTPLMRDVNDGYLMQMIRLKDPVL